MAIGLASAIGLGGKRTSPLEGIDEKIHRIGNEIDAKKMAEDRIKKDMEAKKNAEYQKAVDEIAKGVVFNPEGKTDEDVAELTKIGAKTYAEALKNSTDPNMSYAEKEMRKQQLLQEFKNKVSFAEKEYKGFEDIKTKAQDPTNDVSAMNDLLSGNYGAFETKKDKKGNEISVPTKETNPLYSKYQSTPYPTIPLEERMKMDIDLSKEKEKRIATKNADLNEGLSNMFGGSKDWAKEMIDKHQLADGTTDPKKIDAVIKTERNYLIGALDQDRMNPKAKLEIDKAKKLYKQQFLYQNYSEEEAEQKAEDLAKLDMLNTFDQTVQRQYQIARNERDRNPENQSKGLTINNGMGGGSVGKWNYSAPEDVNQSAYVNSVAKNLMTENGKLTDEAASKIAEESYNKVGKDLKYVSIQTSATGGNSPKIFEVGISGGQKGVANGVLMNKSGKVAYIVVEKPPVIDKYGKEEEPARDEYVTPTSKMLTDYKTNIGAKEWDEIINKSKETLGVKSNSVSSQKGSEKKAEGYTKKDFPWAKVGDVIKAEGQTYKWNGNEWRATDKTSPLSSGDLEKDTQEAKKFGAKYFNNYRETKKTEPSKGAYKSKSGITFEVK